MPLVAPATTKRGRRDLLEQYTEKFGDLVRRHHSAVALRAARVDAELAFQARGAFLASMNHELRTPLNAITGFAGLLRDAEEGTISPEQRREYLDHILQSAELLLAHINTILEIADAESGGAKMARRAFDIGDVLHQVGDELVEELGEDRLAIAVDIPRALPPVDADPDKIATAFRHLVRFIRGDLKEQLHLSVVIRPGVAGKSADYIYVAIDGDGIGYTQSDISEAMRVFERVHEGLDRRFADHRLGLPIAKSYIELNHGKFNIKPQSDGRLLIRFALKVAVGDHQRTYERLAS